MRSNLPVTNVERQLSDGVLIVSRTDLDGRITQVNRDFIEVCGFAEAELLGQPHNILRHPDMPAEAFADLWLALKAGRPWVGTVKNRCKNGDHYWVEAHVAPIWEDGRIVGYMSVQRKASRATVAACDPAYRAFREGRAGGRRIVDGAVVSAWPLARLAAAVRQSSLTAKLVVGCTSAVLITMSMGSWLLGQSMAKVLHQEGIVELRQNLGLVRGMIELRASAMRGEARRLNDIFVSQFPEGLTVETRNGEPLLKHGATVLNRRSAEVDRFTTVCGAAATLFVRQGDDFLRVATSLKKENGERAVDTWLGKAHPAYGKMLSGESYVGKARLFGKDYYTAYQPIKDGAGAVIGIFFVGQDIGADLSELKQAIKVIKVGETGYFYAIDASEGKDRGTAVIHPAKEGQVVLGAKDADGREFIREMLATGRGEIRYPWANSELGDGEAREKIVVFDTVADWQWLIGGGTYLDEFEAVARAMRRLLMSASLVLGLLLVGIIVWLVRRLVHRPLNDQVLPAFRALSAGRYDTALDVGRRDEIGGVMQELETMQNRLGYEVTEARRRSAAMTRITMALDYVGTPVRIADSGGQVIYANRAMTTVLSRIEGEIRKRHPHFRAERFIGENISIFYDDPAAALARLSQATETLKTEMTIGGRRFQVVTSPVISDDGVRLGSVGEWHDRTDEIATEQEVENQVRQAARGDFSGRLRLTDKEGFLAAVAEGLNKLLTTTGSGLQDAAQVLKVIASGDLTRTIENDYAGVFGQFRDETNAMVGRLRELVGKIKEAADAIDGAAREIATGNQDLSGRTEQQASSLEQTARSMDRLNVTVKQNADNARQARDLVHESNDVVARGGATVKSVVMTMSEIQESSRQIVDIIAVIDGIAFQTNILALNAAVEAARAGEQGRGFAVVAAEVRNLAQRTSTAAKEIAMLIQASVAKVGSGAKLVGEAGAAMDEVVASFGRVMDLVTGIADASQEQSVGIAQVTQAVNKMDENTQQNSALVEEAAAAARSLQEQARGLVAMVGKFKLNSQVTAAAQRFDFDARFGANDAPHSRATGRSRPPVRLQP